MYDVIIIGAGPAGYPAAIRAAQYGLKTAIIEKEKTLGGTCLNWGCIPTKTYYESCQTINRIKNAHKYGIDKIENLSFDLKSIKQRKDKIVKSIVKGVEYLLKKNKIDIHRGHAKFIDKNTIRVLSAEKEQKLESDRFLIATGSRPSIPPVFDINDPNIITSNEILELTEIPPELVIIGAGAIGLEFACIFNSLGSRVTIIEMLENLAPAEDLEVSLYLERMFGRQKIKAFTSTTVKNILSSSGSLIVQAEHKDRKQVSINADKVLISTGRIANTDQLDLHNVNINTEKGTIPVNDYGQTSTPNIYAAGDVLNTPQLAHVGTFEAIRAIDHIIGKKELINYKAVPSFIYSTPEISHAGQTEKELIFAGTGYQKAVFPLKAVAKAQILNETEGFVKLLYSSDDHKILGFHMIGALSPELAFEPGLAISKGLTVADISKTIHAHPTIGEAIMEAAHLAEGFPVHILKPE